MPDDDFPPGVGSHEGRELELLLRGEKPVARFRLDGLSEEYERRFTEAVARGTILEFDFPNSEPHLHRRYYCLPTEEWRVRLLELVDRSLQEGSLDDFSEHDLHRIDGTLRGYTKQDIEAFIRWIS